MTISVIIAINDIIPIPKAVYLKATALVLMKKIFVVTTPTSIAIPNCVINLLLEYFSLKNCVLVMIRNRMMLNNENKTVIFSPL